MAFAVPVGHNHATRQSRYDIVNNCVLKFVCTVVRVVSCKATVLSKIVWSELYSDDLTIHAVDCCHSSQEDFFQGKMPKLMFTFYSCFRTSKAFGSAKILGVEWCSGVRVLRFDSIRFLSPAQSLPLVPCQGGLKRRCVEWVQK